MPKIIKNLEQTLMDTAKRIIDEEGYSALSMRRLAEECHVALGTIYNYVEGKDMIVARFMVKEWREVKAVMEKGAQNKDFVKGIGQIYDALSEFCERNDRTWKEYAEAGGSFMANSEMHKKLQEQMTILLRTLAKNSGVDDLSKICPLLAETVVAAAVQDNITKTQLTALAKRLVNA